MSSPDHAGEDPVAVSDVSVTSIESSADHANGRPVFSADSASSPSVGGPSDEVFSPSTSSSSTSSSRGDDRSAGASSSSHPFLARQRDHLAEIRLLSHSSPEKSSGSSSLRVHEDADDSRHDYPEPPSPLHSLGRPRPPYLAKVIGSNAEADPAPLFDLESAALEDWFAVVCSFLTLEDRLNLGATSITMHSVVHSPVGRCTPNQIRNYKKLRRVVRGLGTYVRRVRETMAWLQMQRIRRAFADMREVEGRGGRRVWFFLTNFNMIPTTRIYYLQHQWSFYPQRGGHSPPSYLFLFHPGHEYPCEEDRAPVGCRSGAIASSTCVGESDVAGPPAQPIRVMAQRRFSRRHA